MTNQTNATVLQSAPSAPGAGAHFAELAARLERAKILALLGMEYDPDAFDRLVVAYRRARQAHEARGPRCSGPDDGEGEGGPSTLASAAALLRA